MTLGSSRTRLIAIAGIALLVVAFLWWRGGDDAGSGARDGAGGGAAADRAEAPGRSGGPRRSIDDDKFGAEFRGAGRVVVAGKVVAIGTDTGVGNVDVVFASAAGEETVTSSGDGSFSIEVPPGSYEVRAIGEMMYAAARPLRVGRVADALALKVEVTPLARIVGRVIDTAGTPVSGAKVSLGRQRGVNREQADKLAKDAIGSTVVESGSDGRFEIGALPGDVWLIADDPGTGHGRVELKGVPPGSLEEDVDITLQPYGSLTGVVVGPDGKPRAGVQVLSAIRVPGTRIRQYLETHSDSGGRFEVEGLMPGRAVVEAKASGYAASAPMDIEIVAGVATPEVTLALQSPQKLTGRVVDGTGRPIYQARVKVERHGSGSAIPVTKTEIDGSFGFSTLDGGPYSLIVTQGNYAPARRELPTLPDDRVEVVMHEPGAIRGVVTGADGKPVRQFTVAVERFVPTDGAAPGSLASPSQFASDDGHYEQPSVEPGTYDLLIRGDAGQARKTGVVVAPGEPADGSVQLAP